MDQERFEDQNKEDSGAKAVSTTAVDAGEKPTKVRLDKINLKDLATRKMKIKWDNLNNNIANPSDEGMKNKVKAKKDLKIQAWWPDLLDPFGLQNYYRRRERQDQ